MSNIKITKKSTKGVTASRKVYAAEEDFDDFAMDVDMGDEGEEAVQDAVDDVSDAVEDIQDAVDDVKEDDITIDMNNNITDHYIAECDKCHGIFISAVIESDQKIDHVSGICPLCNKDTDQYLKWIIKDNK